MANRTAAVAAYTAGVSTKNETRAVLDLKPVPDGDEFFAPPTAPTMPGINFPDPEAAKSKGVDPATKYDRYPLRPVVEVLQKWFARQKEQAGKGHIKVHVPIELQRQWRAEAEPSAERGR